MVFCNAAIFSLSLCASFLCKGMNFLFLKRGKYFGFPPLLKWSLLIIFLIWILTFQASAKSGTHSSIGRKGHSFLEPGSLKIFSSRETNTTWRLKTEIRKKIREILQEENSYFIHTPKNDQTIASQIQEVFNSSERRLWYSFSFSSFALKRKTFFIIRKLVWNKLWCSVF